MQNRTLSETGAEFLTRNEKLLMAIGIVIAVLFVVKVVARWRIFTKMGVSGWKSLIPIYNIIVTYDMVWTTAVFWFSVFISFFAGIAGILVRLFQTGVLSGEGKFMHYIYLACIYFDSGTGLLLAILGIIFAYKFSKKFGHGILFALGLLLFPRIFELILAFDQSEFRDE